MAPTLETKYVFTITARIAEVTTAGEIGHGVRRIIPIIGGEVRGEINGKVLPTQVIGTARIYRASQRAASALGVARLVAVIRLGC